MEGPQGRRRLRRGPPPPIEIPGMWFTAMDMAAAEQLIQLSESSGESAVVPEDEALTIAPRSISSALSASSSPLSVGSTSVRPGNRMPPSALAEEDDDDEDLRRVRARYRKLEEVYAEGASADFGGRMWRRRKTGDSESSREWC